MNDEADNSRFVSMHVYTCMHLAFKELMAYGTGRALQNLGTAFSFITNFAL